MCVLPYSTGNGKDDPNSGYRGDNSRRWAKVDIPKLVSLAREMQRKHGADPRRTFIAGYSNGGFYAFETGLRHPEVFSAILCIGGGCNVWDFSEEAKEVGCYIIHGTADKSVKFESGKQAAERLKKAGFRDVVFRDYPGRGHDIFTEEAPRFFPWLAKQKRVLVPGKTSTIGWKEDLAAALEGEKKVLAYFYSSRDGDSALVDFVQSELFRDKGFIEVSSAFTCVKVDRDADEIAKELKVKRAMLALVVIKKEKRRLAWKLQSPSRVASVITRLRSLAKSKR
jgi:predicted esterase